MKDHNEMMMFTIMAGELAEAAAWTAHALPRRATVPVLNGILIEAGDGEVAFSAFDYETSRRRTVEVAVKPGRVLLPGRLLVELAKTLPKGEFVDVEADEAKARIRCGKAVFEIPTMPVEDFPRLPKMPAPAGRIPAEVFAESVARVALAASTDTTLPMLSGMRVEAVDGLLHLAATDRYRIAWRAASWEPALDTAELSAVIPAKTLADVAKGFPAGEQVEVAVDGGLASFSCAGLEVTVRLLDNEFIDVAANFKRVADAPHTAVVDGAELAAVVRRVALLAARSTAVRLAFSKEGCVVQAGNADGGLGREQAACDYSGGDVEVGFNPSFLLDALSAVGGRVEVRMMGHGKPALFVAAGVDEPDYRQILMSMRLS